MCADTGKEVPSAVQGTKLTPPHQGVYLSGVGRTARIIVAAVASRERIMRVKNKPSAAVTVTLLGALVLGGCSSDTSAAEPAPTPSETSPVSPSPAAVTEQLELPSAAGIEVTPVVVDPNMSYLHPEAAGEAQAALTAFLEASRSFPELRKGSRPAQPGDAAILESAIKPLMTEYAWASTVELFQEDNPRNLPSWYEPGNPFDALIDDEGKPLDESWRSTYTPDENGMTYVHSSKQPITVSAWFYDNGQKAVKIKDVQYRAFYRNLEGSISGIQRKITYTFDLQEDGSWLLGHWERHKSGHGYGETQEHLDSLMDF
ncbi:hypothetical protein ACFVRT_16015 [Arthrobacter koreensis]|uniref:hypothetical protein n=1 Tax=Arthrobacter koreensis TaxID=199136 RepID=UPI0036D99E6F